MIDTAQPLDRLLLWGADQVCSIANFLGLTVDVKSGIMRCAYSGSYTAGVIFWALVFILVLFLIRVTRLKSNMPPR